MPARTFSSVVVFGWFALTCRNLKKKNNEWNILKFIYFFFSNLIFLNIPILHANSTLSAFCSWIIFLAWIQLGDILSECQPLDALIQHVFFFFFKFIFRKKINLFTRMLLLLPNCFVCYLPAEQIVASVFFSPFLKFGAWKKKIIISSGLLCHMILHEHYIYYHPDSAHSLCCGLVVDVWWWLC